MSEFRLFDSKAKFLNKAKGVKVKREQETKKTQFVQLIQKNIRAFMTFRTHNSPAYPLLMTICSPSHLPYSLLFWQNLSSQPVILRIRFVKQVIRALTRQEQLANHSNLQTAILEYSQQTQIRQADYQAILRLFWSGLSGSYICKCLKYASFRTALKITLRGLHELVDLIVRVQNSELACQLLSLYLPECKEQEEQEEREERLLQSYFKAVSLLGAAMQNKQKSNFLERDMLIELVSTLVKRMRRFFMDEIRKRYNINQELFQSQSLQEEVEEMLKEKSEWEEYESHLYPLCQLIPSIMDSYMSRQTKGLSSALDLLIEVTKLGQSVVTLNISPEEFFVLVQRLSPKGREGQARNYELLIVVLMVEKYLQSMNDLRFSKLFRYETDRLKDCIRNSIIKFVKGLVQFTKNQSIMKEIYRHAIAFLSNLYNKIFRTNLLPSSVFQDPSINIFQSNYKYANYGNTAYMKEMIKIVELCPFLLPIDTRFLVFRKMVREDMHGGHYYADRSITVHRGREFEDAMEQLYHRDIRSRIHVRFINQYGQEQMGMDAGGLTKELLTRIFKTAFDPSRGRFIENERKELLPNPDYWRMQEGLLAREYEFIGRLLGKSLHENIMLGVKFAGPFLNLLVNNRNSFDDLLLIDPDLYRSLAYIMEMEEGVQELCLTFQYQDQLTKKAINLKPWGEREKVTRHNKTEYVNLLINYKVNRSIQRQTRFVRKGLKAVINDNWIRMFNYAELNYLLSGTGSIDVRDWMAHSRVHGQDCQKLIKDFWGVVGEMTEQEKSLLLKFVTSCERPSFLGFKDLSPAFTIRVMQKDDSLLPASHTCSNILDLPAYSSKQILREKLLYAIKSGAGFEMA